MAFEDEAAGGEVQERSDYTDNSDSVLIAKKIEEINTTFRALYIRLMDSTIDVSIHDLSSFVFNEDQQKVFIDFASEGELLNAKQMTLLALLKLDRDDPEYIRNLLNALSKFKKLPKKDRKVAINFGLHDFNNLLTPFVGLFYGPTKM